jgi:hypothetical protein
LQPQPLILPLFTGVRGETVTVAGDAEHSGHEIMEEVGRHVREVLMPFIEDEQSRAALEEWAA